MWLLGCAALAAFAAALRPPCDGAALRPGSALASTRRSDVWKDWAATHTAGAVDSSTPPENNILPSPKGGKPRKGGGRGRAAKYAETRCTELAYATRLRRLLRSERDEEERVAKERLETWPAARLSAAGMALFGLRARKTSAGLFGRTVIRLELMRGKRKELPYHKFGQGDLVCLTAKRDGAGMVEGTVLSRSPTHLDVVVGATAWTHGESVNWRLDQYFSTVGFERMDAAVDAVCSETSGFKEQRCLAADEGVELELRRVLVRPGESSELAEQRCGGLCHHAPSDNAAKKVLASLNVTLDASQTAAALSALVSRAALIVGPPGTGKTRTAAAVLAAAVKLRDLESKSSPCFRSKALACAASNVAADNLLEQLLGLGVAVVRLGNPASTRAGLRHATLDAKVADLIFKSGEKQVHRISKEQRQEYQAQVLAGCDVVVASCVGAGADVLAPYLSKGPNTGSSPSWKFGTVLIDEAAQATEPACLVPLAAARGARQIILVGDSHQLAPTVISKEASQNGLALSLFERLLRSGVQAFMLTKQYRMHPELNEYSSSRFYGGRVLTDRSVAQERSAAEPPAGFDWPNPKAPLAFVSFRGANAEQRDSSASGDGSSYKNELEAHAVVDLVCGLSESLVDVGVITPYAAQARLIQDLLAKRSPTRAAVTEIDTVDAYQGREKDIIVISAVRSNAERKVGFLADYRRLNVALTRARRAVVVFGDPETLRSEPNWRTFVDHCASKNCVVDATLVAMLADEDAPHAPLGDYDMLR
ncbi:P-loop containing nucleoside triphosphate hydrolase protein [Pelagophyceae sp. CCMP2097]|nr:P-loop containing nucleoside triphosphate hydrolase protein [Pelagophyceae sp. CCMP2097]